MNFELFLTAYRKDDSGYKKNLGPILSGCRALYLVSRDAEEKAALLRFLKRASDDAYHMETQREKILAGMTYFFLYDVTGEEQYKDKMDTCMKLLGAYSRTTDGVFGGKTDGSDLVPWEMRLEWYPFYMEYETRCHNKAAYADVVQQLLMMHPGEQRMTPQTGWYLMTVLDVMDVMSKEIFEHYKSLEEIFKKTIRNILKEYQDWDFDRKESAMMGCSIVKACNMGVLNSEKYADIGLSMIDGLINDSFDLKDLEMAGIAMKAYAQRSILYSK